MYQDKTKIITLSIQVTSTLYITVEHHALQLPSEQQSNIMSQLFSYKTLEIYTHDEI
jgi:hypothetical protein